MALFPRPKVEAMFSEPQALGIALYVRDRLGLETGLAGSPGTRVLPAVGVDGRFLDEGNRGEVSAEWASWWVVLFGGAVLRRTPGPIDYFGPLVREPELGRVAEPLLRDAIAWVAGQADANLGEWGDVRSPTFRPRLVQEMLQKARPRVRGKHSLLFLVLPVEGKASWRVGKSFFSVSKPLLHDLPAFKKWFEAQIPDGL